MVIEGVKTYVDGGALLLVDGLTDVLVGRGALLLEDGLVADFAFLERSEDKRR